MVMGAAEPQLAEQLEVLIEASTTPSEKVFVLTGAMTFRTAGQAALTLLRSLPPSGGTLVLKLARLEGIDSAGVALLVRLWRVSRAQGFQLQLEEVGPQIQERLSLYEVQEQVPAPPEPISAFEALGQTTLTAYDSAYRLLVLTADVTVELWLRMASPWKIRWPQLLQQSVLVGSQAAGIIGLITFMVGLTLAFQSAYQLRQFGAAIYVASLTSISMVREMGPLITAILVAGRSGSSITSEVATMRVNEEIDAMEVIGIPFLQYVALPRVLALMLTLPILTLIADAVGILGGWIVGVVYLGLGSYQYMLETMNALRVQDFAYSMLKVLTFAWGIGVIALYQGFSVSGGAQEVGIATTRSVVNSIFFIIIVTSLYSIIFYMVIGG